MKRIQASADPDAIVKITTALRDAGLSIAAKVRTVGKRSDRISLYVQDDEALAVVMLIKRMAYMKGSRDGKITIN